MTKTVDVQQSPPLSDLVKLAKTGIEVVLVERGQPVARLVAVGSRIPGLHAGALEADASFDEPLADQFWMGKQ